MELVLIYGPPASGKLTVAQALAKRTGYKILHNHMTFNLVNDLLPLGTPGHGRLLTEIRLAIVDELARAEVNVILTFAYAPGLEVLAEKIRGIVEGQGGTMRLVQLRPDPKELDRRIVSPGRAAYGKQQDPVLLRQLLAEQDRFGRIDPDDLSIDNTTLDPETVADMIVSNFGLKAL